MALSEVARSGRSRVARWRWSVAGLVQGVGCRPFVYRLATALGLAGKVWNHPGGVTIELEGPLATLDEFGARFAAELPAPARIDQLTVEECAVRGATTFTIQPSRGEGLAGAVLPDLALCDDCRRELLDPFDRRAGYAFLNCTHCGPRFTIVRDLPYDRARTTMAGFPLCPDCAAEYANPRDRRFHAQPTACPVCGPRLALFDDRGPVAAADPLAEAARRLLLGDLLAVKGLGGYHLACDATNDAAVRRLRERKQREARPLAIMVADLAAAGRLGRVGRAEAALLRSPAAPIVLLDARPDSGLAPSVAPGLPTVGVMLAYTPLHTLLLREAGRPLVMTSGNRSDEPIAHRDDDARARLAPIAEAWLVHDRPIERRCDDSVTMLWRGEPLPLRRSRGYAPAPLRCGPARPGVVLAVGAHQKNTFCFLRDSEAILSHHLGDLENEAALAAFETGIDDFRRLFELTPTLLAHDTHPDYLATRYAVALADQAGLPRVAVQHHHAHIAACLADNEVDGPVLGVAFDGTGLGDDGTIWGGELLLADRAESRRLAHLAPFALAGGEAAVREGWRVALALAAAAEVAWQPADIAPDRAAFVGEMLARQVRCVTTSSAGRLFDGFSALLGLCERSRYEGEGAVLLEAAADPVASGALPFGWSGNALDWRPAVAAALEQRAAGIGPERLAMRFHRGLAGAVAAGCRQAADETGLTTVALSGGCFQNRLLAELVATACEAAGLTVLRHRRVPPNDGGLSLGQAVIAAARGGGG